MSFRRFSRIFHAIGTASAFLPFSPKGAPVINRLPHEGLEGIEMAVALDFDAVLVPVARRGRDVSARTVSLRPAGRSLGTVSSLNCLVVTGDASLRRRLDAAADLAGWTTITAPAAVATLASARRHAHQLVVVDLVSPLGADRPAIESLAREFAGRPDTLLVVCGGEESGSDEAWSRAQGAFVHIPGVSSGDSLVSLFIEARIVSERRSGAESLGRVGSTHAVGVRG
jgi:hypothetical protein